MPSKNIFSYQNKKSVVNYGYWIATETFMEAVLRKEHSIYKYAQEVNLICEKLFSQTPVNYFCLGRIYKNGDYSGLLSDITWAEIYLKNDYQNLAVEHHIVSQLTGTAFWNLTSFHLPNNKLLQVYNTLAELKHASGVFIIEEHPDYKEVAIITTDHDVNSNDPYLIENVSLLKSFILYFKEQIYNHKNLSAAFHKRYQRAMSEPKPIPTPNGEPLHFPIRKYYFDNQFGKVFFTKREAECIKHLYTGKTSKQIAEILTISPRTVETYFEKIKQKTQSTSLFEIRKKLESCELLEGVL